MSACSPVLAITGNIIRGIGTFVDVTYTPYTTKSLSEYETNPKKFPAAASAFFYCLFESFGNALVYNSFLEEFDFTSFCLISFIPPAAESASLKINPNLFRVTRAALLLVSSIFNFIGVSRSENPGCQVTQLIFGVVYVISTFSFSGYSIYEYKKTLYEVLK